MKLCSICATSDILCPGCSRKKESGEIAQADIDVARALRKAGAKADFTRAVEHNGKVIIVCEKKDARTLIGHGGKMVKKLGKELGRDVRVIESAGEKKMIEDILGCSVVGINVVYPAETKRVRVDRRGLRLRGDSALLEKILKNRYEIVLE
jgi:transcription antitermination factor NusA-like protein